MYPAAHIQRALPCHLSLPFSLRLSLPMWSNIMYGTIIRVKKVVDTNKELKKVFYKPFHVWRLW